MTKLTTEERLECVRRLFSDAAGRRSGSNSGRQLLLFAMALAIVLLGSAGIAREAWNARALAGQVAEANEARAEAEEAAQRILKLQQDIVITMATDLEAGRYQRALLFTKAAVQTDPDLRDELFLLCIDALFDGDAEQAQKTFAKGKRE